MKSATGLETIAECSRKAYLRYRLGLKEVEEREILVNRWLTPLERGNLIHDILDSYYSSKGGENLADLVKRRSRALREEIICVLDDVYLREKEDVLAFCQSIVDRSEKDKDWQVLVSELSFGYGPGEQVKDNEVFGILGPQRIKILDLDLSLAGSIDRVDISKDGDRLRIVDYKTGSKAYFERQLRNDEDGYGKTKKLQYYIYLKVLENILRQGQGDFQDARVRDFAYIFRTPGVRGLIDLNLDDEFLETIEERISGLLDLNILENDKNILYDPEDKNLSCRYCPYSLICIVDRGEESNE